MKKMLCTYGAIAVAVSVCAVAQAQENTNTKAFDLFKEANSAVFVQSYDVSEDRPEAEAKLVYQGIVEINAHKGIYPLVHPNKKVDGNLASEHSKWHRYSNVLVAKKATKMLHYFLYQENLATQVKKHGAQFMWFYRPCEFSPEVMQELKDAGIEDPVEAVIFATKKKDPVGPLQKFIHGLSMGLIGYGTIEGLFGNDDKYKDYSMLQALAQMDTMFQMFQMNNQYGGNQMQANAINGELEYYHLYGGYQY